MELQTLTRLPKTQAILFSFKTYLYPVTEIKADGLGPEVAGAIEGLPRGNAPGMWKYVSHLSPGIWLWLTWSTQYRKAVYAGERVSVHI